MPDFSSRELEPRGLSSAGANSLLEKFGPNRIMSRRTAWWQIFLRQFKSPFIYLLLLAALISGILSSFVDALAIIAFISLNSFLGFYQEYTSEKTLQALENYINFCTWVYRDGRIKEIPNTDLVPGDIIQLRPGDIIPADIEFVQGSGLMIDESALTGESIPVAKSVRDVGNAGTSLISGSAIALVTSTGKASTLGRIAAASRTGDDSTFEKDIASFTSFVLRLVLITLAVLFVTNLLIKGPDTNKVELLLFCIALAVSVIPEALPMVITFSLSRGAAHLAKNKVVVKKLLSIEDLGGIQILATDKTGTLTENRLSVYQTYPHSSADLPLWMLAASENAFNTHGKSTDPFDLALTAAISGTREKTFAHLTLVGSVPFDPIHRTSSTVIKSGQGQYFLIRGAPENILHHCRLTSQVRSGISAWIKGQSLLGCRVLAVARTLHSQADPPLHLPVLDFLGLVSFTDPVKKTAAQAVKTAGKLGIGIRVLTGDSPHVAAAVAKKIGLIRSSSQVITGDNFENLSEEDKLTALDSYLVFARTSPFQKNVIVDLLQTKYSVGYLGDGMNDAIALDSADVGLAVSNASQVARQAADIVLLEKDLKIIIDGIHQGRIIAANTSKYITATMASNFGNFYAVAVSSLFISFLPMLPLQILALNLLSDLPMISIATDSVDPEETARPAGFRVHNFIDLAMVLGVVSTVFDFLFFAVYFRISAPVLQTNWFIGSILTELVFIYSIRTKKLFFKTALPSFSLLSLTALAAGITLVLPYTRVGLSVFSFSPPGIRYMAINLFLVIAYFTTTEAVKLVYFRHRSG